MKTPNPYGDLPASAYWRTAVADRHALDISSLWCPKHELSRRHGIATAGSCFAQHFGRALNARGYNWVDAEPCPAFLSESLRKEFNYGVFSFRTGNIYTTALLTQWLRWALRNEPPPDEIWEENGRWFDPFRPNIEPDGFSSTDELLASRASTLDAIRRAVDGTRLFVFTLGLTEAWLNLPAGYVYPMCPGTLRGEYKPGIHVLKNYKYPEIKRDLAEALTMIKTVNRNMRFLLTVSPVPLTATASGHHVLSATTYSKSTLRAVAGDVAERGDTDYFPSYEIITGCPFRGMFFEPNMRSVSRHGVDHVMSSFFNCLDEKFGATPSASLSSTRVTAPRIKPTENAQSDVVCEEELLAAFSPDTT